MNGLKFITILSFSLLAQHLCAQDRDVKSIDNNIRYLRFAMDLDEVVALAQKDIVNGTAQLITESTIAPYTITTDANFEEKYGLGYSISGCVGYPELYAEMYNFQVFQLLEKKYGKRWRREVRKDTVGLKKWKKSLKQRYRDFIKVKKKDLPK